jgi:hypothetical protein
MWLPERYSGVIVPVPSPWSVTTTLFVTNWGASVVVVGCSEVEVELVVVGATEDAVVGVGVGVGVVGAAASPPDEHATSARQHVATTVAFTVATVHPSYRPMVCAILSPTACPSAKPSVLSTWK